MSDWEGVRLHVVTGKGGTGKTTVAAALALALAVEGRRVLLAEVEGRQGIARLFDTPPLDYAERKLATGPRGGDVFGLAIDAEQALREYFALFYHLGPAGSALERLGAIDFATTVAPGLRDVLLTGKAYEAAKRRTPSGFAYHAVVLDGPPTGRITRFLNVNTEVAGLAKVGPIHHQAESIMNFVKSPRTAVHLATLLADMPVQETVDGIGELRAAGLQVGAVIVNQVRTPLLTPADLDLATADRIDPALISAGLTAAGLSPSPSLVGVLRRQAAEHAARIALEEHERAVVADLGRPVYELPRLTDGVDLGGLYDLALALYAQGAT
ncbi:MAG: ATPase [Sporichthyaceae bacterium]|nr:ATPase [Sporichthyaceae bacterium]